MSPALDYSKIADLYDSFVDFDIDIPFFIQECAGIEGPVLEVMSGTGRVSLPLLEEGVDLTCVDSSVEMLMQLRRKALARSLRIRALAQDVTRLGLSRSFELALIPFHSFQELAEREEQRAALASIYSVLARTGRLVCTLQNPIVRLRSFKKGPWTVARSSTKEGELSVELDVVYDKQSHQVHGTQVVETRGARGELLSRQVLRLRFALIHEVAFRKLADEVGFVVETLYGDYDRSPFTAETSPYMIWGLQRGARGQRTGARVSGRDGRTMGRSRPATNGRSSAELIPCRYRESGSRGGSSCRRRR